MIDVVQQRGTVAELHGLEALAGPVTPALWWCRPTDDAVVLGSRQSADLVDPDACAAAGLSIVRRRSGGSAVIVRRSAMHWIDLVVPHGYLPDDIRGSMEWFGERWVAAIGRDDLVVHRGGMHTTEWSELVCFAGVGPGEVLAGDRKVVGLCQRRTRHGVRIQALVPTGSVAHEYPSLFVGPTPTGLPDGQGWIDGLAIDDVVGRLARRITPM